MGAVKKFLRNAINYFLPTESPDESKRKWNALATKNAPYYVMTDFGEGITEEQFRASGMKDYSELIKADVLLQSHLSPFSEKNVLEIGCGLGRITEFISKDFQSVSAIDISEEMIAKAKKRLASTTNISFQATDGVRFPFPENSFDFVFSFIVFQHMPDVATVRKNISEISRVLKSDGIAKIQLRGLPTSKLNWFYGPSFTKKNAEKLVKSFDLKVIETLGENQRYFWLWLKKEK